jgi:hypothetical protein
MRYIHLFIMLCCIALFSACSINNDQTEPASPDGSAPANVIIQPTLNGKVVDKNGTPVEQAQVIVAAGTAAVPEKVVLTTSEGLYEWNLPDGTFTITVTADDYASVSQDVTIQNGQPVTLDFTLQ